MIIEIFPKTNHNMLAIIAVEQELYYGNHVAHILEYYKNRR